MGGLQVGFGLGWKRPDDSQVLDALSWLGVSVAGDFADFFRNFWGPFGSGSTGHELLDLVEEDESVLSNTQVVRQEFHFPDRFIVLSTLYGGSVLVYDLEAGLVYDVDFEGGDELLKSGTLRPRWQSWKEFISDYFS